MLSVLLTIVLIGVVLWAINTYVPMEPRIKSILNVATIVLLVVWLISVVLGVGPVIPSLR